MSWATQGPASYLRIFNVGEERPGLNPWPSIGRKSALRPESQPPKHSNGEQSHCLLFFCFLFTPFFFLICVANIAGSKWGKLVHRGLISIAVIMFVPVTSSSYRISSHHPVPVHNLTFLLSQSFQARTVYGLSLCGPLEGTCFVHGWCYISTVTAGNSLFSSMCVLLPYMVWH